jgi:hypothetical protein
MRAIIDGKRYDTETSEQVCDISPSGLSYSDFSYEDTQLYVTKRGNFFLAGEGNAMSRWSQPHGQRGRRSGSGVQALDREDARRLLEELGKTAAIERHFADQIEDA